ncbi:phage holin [Alkalicoccus luteus]|uniref:Phage holin n=1 Tax=Alkalicoccus luteus TaxID=1237094 RepID=A0A969PQY5_9BACI|nr:phage holin [Alkalicoccus luteus]NJP37935.1 phage holin [Alkalicoccus luteus]
MDKMTIARTAALALALINQLLASFGYSPLPFDEQQVEVAVSSTLTAAAAVWAWWKNNSVTKEAQEADEVMKQKKAAKKEAFNRE